MLTGGACDGFTGLEGLPGTGGFASTLFGELDRPRKANELEPLVGAVADCTSGRLPTNPNGCAVVRVSLPSVWSFVLF